VQVYWEAEAASVTASKPQLSMMSIRLANPSYSGHGRDSLADVA